jgi:quercetin dioxygenase-like cupin family protein
MAPIETTQLAVPSGARRGKSFEAGGFGVIFKIYGEETNGLLSVVEHPIEPGILIPPHIHEVEDEYSYVLEGEIGARIGDQVLRAPVGTYVLKPRNVWHTFWNAGPQPARILEMISPAGFEKFFEELGELFRSGEATPARREALAAKYHHRFSMDWVEELKGRYNLRLLGEPPSA